MGKPDRIFFILVCFGLFLAHVSVASGIEGTHPYDAFERPQACASCHIDIARQHEQAMMSQSYTHIWDEIEYFELAVPHARKDPKVAEVEAGCNGCHAPLALMAGDVPPPRPSENSRANEGVSCDLCHTMTGFEGDTPFNFNWIVDPGKTKRGPREGLESPHHVTVMSEYHKTAEFCGACHNEKNPWNLFVKSTHLEWKEGPHGKAGIVCQSCHMPPAAGRSARMGSSLPDVRQHLFHGAHDPGKLAGVIEVRIHPETREAEPGDTIKLTAVCVNAKAGHKVPTGSVEDRALWLHVTATDAEGTVYHLPVDRKGFEGEEYTVASSSALGYQDIGEIKEIPDFKGLKRDGEIPDGDRIFRMAYLDPKGRITISQWYTASFGYDYRLAPLEARAETFTWNLPDEMPAGPVVVTAEIWYTRLVSSVAQFLKVPEEEWEPIRINSHATTFTILD
ncbi:MAG TPA: multiheme c-type cytochrome [Thermoanaerobaculia bacterium]|nr:multiheme c-type cytochrome [Thermoanaerobaculia bacterium]HUM28786.1 multiheme c-type cytochrome [Thermoanaerobaculia bacterium]HXK67964.1 multiheme c-type cytochrome [Thermoanaerobaculia bacterium]